MAVTMATMVYWPACSYAYSHMYHTMSHFQHRFRKSWEVLYWCIAELPWRHWGGVWLQATHHRRGGHRHRNCFGKCGIVLNLTHVLTENANYVYLHPILQVFGMIFSMLLCCAIRKSREVVWRPPSHPGVFMNVAWCHSWSHMTLHCHLKHCLFKGDILS